jgi:hypothetical protein
LGEHQSSIGSQALSIHEWTTIDELEATERQQLPDEFKVF